jgi:hypothetical protein
MARSEPCPSVATGTRSAYCVLACSARAREISGRSRPSQPPDSNVLRCRFTVAVPSPVASASTLIDGWNRSGITPVPMSAHVASVSAR